MKKRLLLLSAGGGGSQPTLISKNISANGTYAASSDSADGYSSVTVAVQPNLGTKSITDNGTYTAVADSVDGYSSVTVAVPEKTLTTKTITQNGAYAASEDSVDGYSSLTVSVLPNLGTKTITQNGAYAASEDNLDGYSSFTVNVGGTGERQLKRNVFNYDGTLLKSDTISEGDAVYLPTEIPTIDDELIEFDEWTITTDEATVTNSYNIAAICKIKEKIDLDGTLVSPTIIEINLEQSIGLEPTLRLRYLRGAPLYIDWGDGTIENINESGSGYGSTAKQHTYSSGGKYYIKLYSLNEYSLFSTSWNNYVFGSEVYNRSVTKAYLGDNWGEGGYAFYRCTLTKCIITKGVLNLTGSYCLDQCFGLNFIAIPKGITTLSSSFAGGEGIKTVVLPYTMTSYGANCFSRIDLKNFVIPNHMSSLPTRDTNYFCEAGEYIKVPASVTSVGTYAFVNFLSKYIDLPNTCVSYGTGAFQSCTALKSIKIPENTISLPMYCFAYCECLNNIELPSTLTTIAMYCFQNCKSLKELIIPNNVTTLGSNFIDGCYGLKTLKIPAGFSGALNLAKLYSLSDASYVSIAQDLADLTGSTAQTLSIQNWQQAKLANMMVDSNGDLDATSSTSLIDFITAKNWTVTIVS